MLLRNLLPVLAGAAFSSAHPALPSTCPIGKICPWSWGQIYTIYEDQPNLTAQRDYYQGGDIFIASQAVGRDKHCKDDHTPHSRIYTVMTQEFSGLGSNGCTLDFNNPCNSSTPFYHQGNAIIAARAVTYLPGPPTWNNIIPLIEPTVLGRYGGKGGKPWKRDTFEQFSGNVCGGANGTNINAGQLTFVYGIDEDVKETASVTWNQTLINEDIVVGVYLNFTC